MNKIYPLEWFDLMISQTLNPKNPMIEKLSKQDFTIISEHIEKESKNIQNSLKKEIFLLRKKREVRLQVRKYHSNVIYLLDVIIEYQKANSSSRSEVLTVYELLQIKLEELLSVIERRFSDFLSLDERVPITYLMLSRNEIELKLKTISAKAIKTLNDDILKIVVKNISEFLETFSGKKITYRQLLYHKDLLKCIKIVEISKEVNLFSGIDKLLIEMNFNSSEYIDYVIKHINYEIEVNDSVSYRITKLLFYQKEFDRIYSNEKRSFDSSRNNIKYVLGNWFKQEINYLERTLELSKRANFEDKNEGGPSFISHNKMECDLSADQIALILRAVDESRIVKARSMNHFFKIIVPYLSTPFKKDLSYQSVRSKSYNAEDRDKNIAVQALERIIKKINSY